MKGLEDLNYCVKNFFPLGTPNVMRDEADGIRLQEDFLAKVAQRCPEMREFRLSTVTYS